MAGVRASKSVISFQCSVGHACSMTCPKKAKSREISHGIFYMGSFLHLESASHQKDENLLFDGQKTCRLASFCRSWCDALQPSESPIYKRFIKKIVTLFVRDIKPRRSRPLACFRKKISLKKEVTPLKEKAQRTFYKCVALEIIKMNYIATG